MESLPLAAVLVHLVLLSVLMNGSESRSVVWDCSSMLESCELLSGIRGFRGAKGDPGLQGNRGSPGSPALKGPRGEPGTERGGGSTLIKGKRGDRGVPGLKGFRGFRGLVGSPGDMGENRLPGRRGSRGPQGDTGIPGPVGARGDTGLASLNWKQCAFKLDVNKQNGTIHTCIFHKSISRTALHVTYQGDTHVGLCGTCCKKWEFKINGRSCSPPIEAVYDNLMLVNNDKPNVLPVFWHGNISGYCSSVASGFVRVAMVIKNCSKFPSDSIVVNTKVKTTARIIIQETQPPQP